MKHNPYPHKIAALRGIGNHYRAICVCYVAGVLETSLGILDIPLGSFVSFDEAQQVIACRATFDEAQADVLARIDELNKDHTHG